MIHPSTIVKPVSPLIGNGVFATELLKKGTIVVVRDRFDIVLSQQEFSDLPEVYKASMETYLYHDKHGHLVLSWDHARYMNHSCSSNTMMTDYGFEIAVRDILPQEEITSEYGLLNIQEPYKLECGCQDCRVNLCCDDIDRYAEEWDCLIKESIKLVPYIEQPLISLLNREVIDNIMRVVDDEHYSSVRNLKWGKSLNNGAGNMKNTM